MRFEARTKAKSRLSLTPIIDVVFLLLLFFMLASTFTRYAHVEVAIGGRAQARAQEPEIPNVLLSVKGQGEFSVNGEDVTLDGMQNALASAAPDGRARIFVRPASASLSEDIVRAIERSQAARLGPVIMIR